MSTGAPAGPLWLALHPLVIGALGGALLGAPSLGLIVGAALTPLLSERDDAEVAAAATFAAVLVAQHLSSTRGLGGILNESWLASTLALVAVLIPTFLLAQLHTTLVGRGIKATATLVIVVLVGFVVPVPTYWWSLAPWVAGALFLVGLGRLAGSPADPDRSHRRLATLLSANFLAQACVIALPVVWLLGERLRSKEPSGRAFQGLTAVGALLGGFTLGWIPYQLPAWDAPRFPLPSGEYVLVTQPTTAFVLPLIAAGAALYYAWGRAVRE